MATLVEAANAALGGGAKKMRVLKHEFNVKPVKHGWEGDRYWIRGRLSHCKGFFRDDQFDYSIGIRFHPPDTEASENIDLGGFTSIVAPVVGSAIGGLAPFPLNLAFTYVSGSVAEGFGNLIEQKIAGKDWQSVARGIVATICADLLEEAKATAPPPPLGYKPPKWVEDVKRRLPPGARVP
jgi:hypothetical protein